MRKAFILMSLDGPYSNVMKFKPPLCFNKENATHLIATLDAVLTELSLKSQLWFWNFFSLWILFIVQILEAKTKNC